MPTYLHFVLIDVGASEDDPCYYAGPAKDPTEDLSAAVVFRLCLKEGQWLVHPEPPPAGDYAPAPVRCGIELI